MLKIYNSKPFPLFERSKAIFLLLSPGSQEALLPDFARPPVTWHSEVHENL
jgi:hypothetical protein